MLSYFVIPLIGAISNRVRGKIRYGKIINVILFGLTAYYLTHSIGYSICIGLAMLLGQSFKIFSDLSDVAIHNKDFPLWFFVVLKRGLVWGIPLAAVSAFYYGPNALWFILTGLMPICYLPKYFDKPDQDRWWLCEYLFGIPLWSAFILATL